MKIYQQIECRNVSMSLLTLYDLFVRQLVTTDWFSPTVIFEYSWNIMMKVVWI